WRVRLPRPPWGTRQGVDGALPRTLRHAVFAGGAARALGPGVADVARACRSAALLRHPRGARHAGVRGGRAALRAALARGLAQSGPLCRAAVHGPRLRALPLLALALRRAGGDTVRRVGVRDRTPAAARPAGARCLSSGACFETPPQRRREAAFSQR